MIDNLIEFWRRLDLLVNNYHYVHPDDVPFIDPRPHVALGNHHYVNLENCLVNNNTLIHTGLIPVPYAGDIRNAPICLIMLNPGFHTEDYEWEYNNNAYRNALINNLYQQNFGNYPFFYLDPQFDNSPGGRYWRWKFGNIANHLADQFDGTTSEDIFQLICRNVCVFEPFAYHSQNLGVNNGDLMAMPSFTHLVPAVGELVNDINRIPIVIRRVNNLWVPVANENGWQELQEIDDGIELENIEEDTIYHLPTNQAQAFPVNPNYGIGRLIVQKKLQEINGNEQTI